ncbi:E3 ubiquitin-protein ligase MIB2 [Ischnura elegans]|uniref:E3 ubiquitin-protein ligase MIB2 n=1 Tax=Ischnura elegans TaxID=197161 RepID=UPI001ED88C4D|nr:E3 ubiquitin-protein ligase MIB2 [Ischnura elegans]
MLDVGVRVVRGPHWKWGNQDGGEGHVGTVVELGRAGSQTSPDKTVVVLWDSGTRTNYRVGYQGSFDLRVVDNAPAGVKHPNIICDACRKCGIAGMRWKCIQCEDYDLCTACYMSDMHDLTHVFQRFETANSLGENQVPRMGCFKMQLKGIFVGAKVMRGLDWDWGNQDGGEGKTGRVIDIRGWDNESGRSVANVTWTGTGSTNVYRVGHKGKVDLKYVQPGLGGFYYRDHLPVLGQDVEQQLVNASIQSPGGLCSGGGASGTPGVGGSPSHHPTFSVGDKVNVLLSVEKLKQLQWGHGGWNPRMAEYIGKFGTVHRVTEKGDIRVQYEGCNNRWTFHPAALTKVYSFAVGDVVRVISDVDKVKELQKNHGEWIDVMRSALGMVGRVIRVYGDGDLRVSVDGKTWTFNPLCVRLVPGSATEVNNTMATHPEGRIDRPNPLASLLSNLLEKKLESTSIDMLVREAAQGHLTVVRDFLLKFPEMLDQKSSGKTCLQVACHQGHIDLVRLLLNAGAVLEVTDDDGDTALHYSAFGNQPEIMELLLSRGANVDAINKGQCTALHVAVNKQYLECVCLLLKYKCNVNVQDSYGDTALHDAISKESLEIIRLLCRVPGVDFTLKNVRGFNVLHHAALKGNNFATEQLLMQARQLVDVKKDDGFAALHLAALNGHYAVAETLLTQGQADVDLRNNRKQTPLLLAISQGHCSLVELLVSRGGASVNAEDEDGDIGLHLALMKKAFISAEINELEAPSIHEIFTQLQNRTYEDEDGNTKPIENKVAFSIACYLVQQGCDLNKQNRRGRSPLQLLPVPALISILREYSARRSISVNPSASHPTTSSTPSPALANRQPSSSAAPVERQMVVPGDAVVPPLLMTVAVSDVVNGGGASSRVGSPLPPLPPPSMTTPASSASPPLITGNKFGLLTSIEAECTICSEPSELVVLEPCGHRVACADCSVRMKKCLKCGGVVIQRVTMDGRPVSSKPQLPGNDRVQFLANKLAEMEEALNCSICMERKRTVAFLCGHSACDKCSHTLKICHMCRKTITKKINLYP